MNDLDFVKKCCEYADGFEHFVGIDHGYETDNISDPHDREHEVEEFDLKHNQVEYPLLLQRAIEGVNMGNRFEISMFKDRLFVTDYEKVCGDPFFYRKFTSVNTAKRSALEYVFEQEEK